MLTLGEKQIRKAKIGHEDKQSKTVTFKSRSGKEDK